MSQQSVDPTPTPLSSSSSQDSTPTTPPFPLVMLAAVIVSAGIWLADEINPRAAWALALLVLLTVAFGYSHFGDQLVQIFGGKPSSGGLNTGVSQQTPTPGGLVGPVGPVGGRT